MKSAVAPAGGLSKDGYIAEMVDESSNEHFDIAEDVSASLPDVIADLVVDTAIPGIPAPVRRNFLKAFGQLCAAAVDIPVAYLTGVADERRAETAARISLINTSAAQIARQMQTDPECARVAVQKFGQRVLREQVNLDLISQRAANEILPAGVIGDQNEQGESDDTISDDWLNAFEAEARQKSTEEIQVLFGKVLAGEIRKPGTFSTRAVRILGSLDRNTASHFAKLRSMCISQFQDMRVPSPGGNAGDNALQDYGLNFDTLNLLNEHGLVISDYHSWREITPSLPFPGPRAGQQAICVPLRYQGKHWILLPSSSDYVGKRLRINGVALTSSGRELSKIVQIEPVDEYSKNLAEFFKRNGFQMTAVGDAQPRVLDLNLTMGQDP